MGSSVIVLLFFALRDFAFAIFIIPILPKH
jgi:hypothetical protein